MDKVAGRNREKQMLSEMMKSFTPEFVAVYGRRRIGKTFLIKEFFNHEFTFFFTGTANVGMKQQLSNFHIALLQYSKTDHPLPNNWFEAFEMLKTIIEKDSKPHKIIFIDELPWLDTPRSNFVSALEYFWNSYGSGYKGIKLIVCGSAASWMINKLIKNKGGLHNRVTKRISIAPFTLGETELFFRMKGIFLDKYQIIQLYAVMGGVPFYLNEIEPGKSAAQNIDQICFSDNGLLRIEYNQLYASLFTKAEHHMDIIQALSSKAKGLTREAIIHITKLPNGGKFTNTLNELETSGFIKKYTPFQKKSRGSLYQLTDPYSLFYHKFIKDSKATGKNTWLNLSNGPKYSAWSGYAFEYICFSHLSQIKKALGIEGVYTEESSWSSNNSEKGAQIDLLIDRKDGIINICEAKYSHDKFTISKAYASELQNKINLLKAESGTKKSVFITMITTFGVTQNQNAIGLIQNEVTMDDLFNRDSVLENHG